ATYRPDHSRLGRIDFYFSANSHDAKIDGAIESFAVAGIGELQEPLPPQHALWIGSKYLEQSEFRGRQGMFVAFIVAQGLRLKVEPFGAEPHQRILVRF